MENCAALRERVRLRVRICRVGRKFHFARSRKSQRAAGDVERAAASDRHNAFALRFVPVEPGKFHQVARETRVGESRLRHIGNRRDRAALRRRSRINFILRKAERSQPGAVDFPAVQQKRAARCGRLRCFAVLRRRVSESVGRNRVVFKRHRSRERHGSRVLFGRRAIVRRRAFFCSVNVDGAALQRRSRNGNGAGIVIGGNGLNGVFGKRCRSRERNDGIGNGECAAARDAQRGLCKRFIFGKSHGRAVGKSRAPAVANEQCAAAELRCLRCGIIIKILDAVVVKSDFRRVRGVEISAGNGDGAALRVEPVCGIGGKIQCRSRDLQTEFFRSRFIDDVVRIFCRSGRTVGVQFRGGNENRAAARRGDFGNRAIAFKTRRSRAGNFEQSRSENRAAGSGKFCRCRVRSRCDFAPDGDVPAENNVPRQRHDVRDICGNERAAVCAVIRGTVGDEAAVFDGRSRAERQIRRNRIRIRRRKRASGFFGFVGRSRECEIFDGKRHAA